MAVVISTDSIYKDTPVFEGDRGPEFGAFVPPVEFNTPDENYKLYRLESHEVGFLDLVANKFWGQGSEIFQRGLMLANAMLDPEVDMFAGQELIIPPRDALLRFQSRSGLGAT